MNAALAEKWSWVEGTHALRTELLDALTDADLAFTPGGDAMTLGALCREMGEVEHAYVQSLKTFKQDWSYRNTEAGLENSAARLKAWYQTLDDEMRATLDGYSDADAEKTIDRSGYPMPIGTQLDIYMQALLIFFGKATIYLRVMRKPLPEKLKEWVW